MSLKLFLAFELLGWIGKVEAAAADGELTLVEIMGLTTSLLNTIGVKEVSLADIEIRETDEGGAVAEFPPQFLDKLKIRI